MNWGSPYDENPFKSNQNASRSIAMDNSSVPLNSQAAPPAWLQDGTRRENVPEPAYAAVAVDVPGSVDNKVDDAIPRMILYTRIANLVLSICMIIASLLSLLTTDTATTGVLACYVVVFSCLLCCYETHLKQVSKLIALNFGFLYSAKSRAVFMIFVGTILFSFSLFGKIIGLCMLINAGFNVYILVKYPGYDAAQRKDAQSEISDYLAANPAFAQHVVSMGVKATSDFVASNPEIARQGAQAMFAQQQQQQQQQYRPSTSTDSLDTAEV